MKKKIVLIAMAVLVLALSVAVGTTVAWLMDTSETVENTFTIGDINIELSETTGSDYKIVPGGKQAKDPTVTVKAKSEKCYVYVLIDNTVVLDGTAVAVPNISDANWEKIGSSGTKTLYRYKAEVAYSDNDQTIPVFTEVSYANTIEKGNINDLTGKKITITAYAHQAENISSTDADTIIKNLVGIS